VSVNEPQNCVRCHVDNSYIELVPVDYYSEQVPTEHGHMQHYIKPNKVDACEFARLYAERDVLKAEVERLRASQTVINLTIHNNYPSGQKESQPISEQIKQSMQVADWGI
jgi:hypothetical protein